MEPAGFPDGYAQLAPGALQMRVSLTEIEVAVASLADVEHSKRIAGREKDRDYLEEFGRLRERPDSVQGQGVERNHGHQEELQAPER
jgi:hypothetical protein